jgi:hypothetical protein
MPAWYFNLRNVESRGRETVEIANANLTQSFRNGVTDRTNVGCFQSCQSLPRL